MNDATAPCYRRRSVNCTVNAPELEAGLAKQRKDFADYIAKNQEYKRVPKGERKLTNMITEELQNGSIKRTTTTTTRKEY